MCEPAHYLPTAYVYIDSNSRYGVFSYHHALHISLSAVIPGRKVSASSFRPGITINVPILRSLFTRYRVERRDRSRPAPGGRDADQTSWRRRRARPCALSPRSAQRSLFIPRMRGSSRTIRRAIFQARRNVRRRKDRVNFTLLAFRKVGILSIISIVRIINEVYMYTACAPQIIKSVNRAAL